LLCHYVKQPDLSEVRIDSHQRFLFLMEKSSAKATIESPALVNVDHIQVLDIVYKKETRPYSSVNTPLAKKLNLFLKRTVDLVVSSLLILFIFSWLFPIVAILIWIDSKGPVFFLQKRNKKNGEVFTCIKFRTMVVNDEADVLPAYENDHRITRFGRILRNYHIDELPQLFNVLWGDMSLIGPRPHMFTDNQKYSEIFDFYHNRHQVKPGITGLAQVRGYVGATQDDERMKKRVKLDLFYIRHWSPVLDIKIIFLTFLRILGV
jgi:putative colanic acid biosynthesis UDP-glucose lipid carrier transferase